VTPRLARWIVRLYPVRWRCRYGAELEALLEDSSPDVRDVLDVVAAGMEERLRAELGAVRAGLAPFLRWAVVALLAQVELLVAVQLVAAVAGHALQLGLAAGGLVFFRLEGPLSIHVGGGLVLVAGAAGFLAARRACRRDRYAEGAPQR
jgi:hypothetical protein